MANNIATLPENAGRVTAPSTAYPLGSAKDDSTGTAGDGTPIKVAYMNDLYGWQQALLRSAGLAPTGNADTAVESQYLQAIAQLASGRAVWFDDVGAADAYVLALRTNQQAPNAVFDGMTLSFEVSASNTGPSTVDVSALLSQTAGTTVLSALDHAGAPLLAGALSGRVSFFYDAGAGALKLGDKTADKLDKAGVQSITGTAVFDNTENSVTMAGIGGQGWEVDDVIGFTGSPGNDKLFTIDDIDSEGKVVVNYAHRGGTSSKSLVDGTATVTCYLVSKWNVAGIALGRGPCDVKASMVVNTEYDNDSKRPKWVSVYPTGNYAQTLGLDGYTVGVSNSTTGLDIVLQSIVPSYSKYELVGNAAGLIDTWLEVV